MPVVPHHRTWAAFDWMWERICRAGMSHAVIIQAVRRCVDGEVARLAQDLTYRELRWLGEIDLGQFTKRDPQPCMPAAVYQLPTGIIVYVWPVTVGDWDCLRSKLTTEQIAAAKRPRPSKTYPLTDT